MVSRSSGLVATFVIQRISRVLWESLRL